VKIVHLAKLVSPEGDVSPLCAKTPRKLNLKKETWTNRPEAVTCLKCNLANRVQNMPENMPPQA